MRARSCFSDPDQAPLPRRPDLEDGFVGRHLVQDLLPEHRLVALADALEVAERTVEAHAAVDHPGAALGEGHQIDFIVAAFSAPGERPAWRPSFVAYPATAAKPLLIDSSQQRLDHGLER